MSISKNLAKVLMQYKQEYGLSFEELAQKLNLPKSSTVNYCNGTGNPRADTLELLAERCGMPVTTMVSGQPPGWEQAETIGDWSSDVCSSDLWAPCRLRRGRGLWSFSLHLRFYLLETALHNSKPGRGSRLCPVFTIPIVSWIQY